LKSSASACKDVSLPGSGGNLLRSLKIKFILLLLLGGTIAGVIGLWLTHKAANKELDERLRVRAETLASAINHTAMVRSSWSTIQHVIDEIVREQPDINSIAVVSRQDRNVLVAAGPGWQTGPLENIQKPHAVSSISAAVRHGRFGHHVERGAGHDTSGDMLVISPLAPALEQHRAQQAADVAPAAGHLHASSPGEYRGAILIRVSRAATARGTFAIDRQYAGGVLASILVILLVALVTLKHQVLTPLQSIRNVIDRRNAGDTEARITLDRKDELAAVAQALNATLDKGDEQGRELMRINSQLTQSVIRSETASIAKSEFLANMSHELRTPLNAVIGFSEVIREQTFGPVGNSKYIAYADDIQAAGKHLLQLINDILDISKIEAEKEELNEGLLAVGDLVQSSLSIVRGQADKNRIAIEVDLEDPIPPLNGDERKLRQALINVLSNAVKFTPEDGRISVRSWCRQDSGLVIQIADTGIGIAPEDIPKALSQFGQVDSDLNRSYEGTGLGLPLTKALVEMHGGSFDLQSRVGAGTTVTIRLPASRVASGDGLAA